MTKYPIIDEGVDLLKESELFVGITYPDPVSPLGKALQKAGLWQKTLKGASIPPEIRYVNGKELSGKPWTNGNGFTDGVKEGDTIGNAAADSKLARLLKTYVDPILAACKVEPNENQLAAMVVCAWNIGLGWDPSKPKPAGAQDGFRNSSIMKAHNRGDFAAAARAFALWNKAGGAVIQALVTRRAREAALYAKPVIGRIDTPTTDDEVGPEPMPQTVQSEGSLLKSPIIQSTVGGATTTIATLASVADQANTAKSAFDVLQPMMPYLPYIAIAIVIVVAGVIIWQRVKQRRGGWA